MADVCTDNRFELIAKYKAKLVEATKIETDKAEMDVIDNVLFRIWQMGWLDRLEQFVPVVHCAECKWADWYETKSGKFCGCWVTEKRGLIETDYCSFGEMDGKGKDDEIHSNF